jgi:hypothetical protein
MREKESVLEKQEKGRKSECGEPGDPHQEIMDC